MPQLPTPESWHSWEKSLALAIYSLPLAPETRVHKVLRRNHTPRQTQNDRGSKTPTPVLFPPSPPFAQTKTPSGHQELSLRPRPTFQKNWESPAPH